MTYKTQNPNLKWCEKYKIKYSEAAIDIINAEFKYCFEKPQQCLEKFITTNISRICEIVAIYKQDKILPNQRQQNNNKNVGTKFSSITDWWLVLKCFTRFKIFMEWWLSNFFHRILSISEKFIVINNKIFIQDRY